MAIGLTEEHEALAASVRGLAERHLTPDLLRGIVRGDEPDLATFWKTVTDQGLLGLHLPEQHGGQGFSLVEQAVAVEELGRRLVPGPYLPTVLASALIAASGQRSDLLAGLADGSVTAAVAFPASTTIGVQRRDEGLVLNGTVSPVLGLGDLILLPLPANAVSPADAALPANTALPADAVSHDDPTLPDDSGEWAVVRADQVGVEALESLDLTRAVVAVSLDEVVIPDEAVLTVPDAGRVIAVLLGAEACGVAGWTLSAAAEYARTREQFGRPIGQFQGVKHRCARMLIELERARAAVWDAARSDGPDPAHVAAILAPDAAVACAEGCIQVHGGIGYTFEHDAHLYYRRALTLRALAGRTAAAKDALAARALKGVRHAISVELPEDAEPLRAEIRVRVAELAALDPRAQRAAMAAGGWVTPHLPKPWGRDASPREQIVIQQELKAAGVRPVPLMIAAWAVPSIVQYGTPEQQERFLPPTLRGEIIWCQLFSEPGAGSDLAALRTRAVRVEGGWEITGQKIWTSLARDAQWGICIARTDPDAPKHEGITYFLVDMAAPGIEIRPLRECTGDAVFNEVFLDAVFVPDEQVVGPVNAGWRVARNTLANERVGLTSSFQLGGDLPMLVTLAAELGLADDPVVRSGLGELVADEYAFRLLGLRATLRQLSGTDPGATANVRKLVAMEHGQRVTEFGFGLLGGEGALTGGHRADLRRKWTRLMLAARAMTIGGGTTEVNLNVIAERILGLPRD